WLLSLRVAVRDWPCASSQRLLWQQRASADGQYPLTLTGQDVSGAALEFPPVMVAPPWCL
ncbi:MAG: hypothetical protein AB7P69_07805, partial [Candidatus Binatia bacterium]